MLLQIFKYKFLCGHMFSINLSINWRIKLLGHTVTLCLTFWGTAKLFSKVTTPFYNIPAMFKVLSSVQFSRSVASKSSWPRALQHARPPCPSQLPEFTQTHVHWVGDAIQPSHPLLSPSPPTFNLGFYGFWFFHVLAYTCYSPSSFILDILMGLRACIVWFLSF